MFMNFEKETPRVHRGRAPRNPHDVRRDAGVSWHRKEATRDGGMRTHDVMKAQWVAESRIDMGTVVLAQIRYEDANDFKTRPAIVVSRDRRGVVVIPCTSADSALRHGALELMDLRSAGLTKRTFVRRGRVTIDRVAVLAVLGHIGEIDSERLAAQEVAA